MDSGQWWVTVLVWGDVCNLFCATKEHPALGFPTGMHKTWWLNFLLGLGLNFFQKTIQWFGARRAELFYDLSNLGTIWEILGKPLKSVFKNVDENTGFVSKSCGGPNKMVVWKYFIYCRVMHKHCYYDYKSSSWSEGKLFPSSSSAFSQP